MLVSEVGVVEEPAEEDEVAGVHQERQLDVLVGHAALQTRLLHLDHLQGNKVHYSRILTKLLLT